MPDQKQLGEGVHIIRDYAIGNSSEPQLVAMAKSDAGVDGSAAAKAVEILLDDMDTNLSTMQTGLSRSAQAGFVTQCMQESLDNINEFLHFQLSKAQLSEQDVYTSLAAIQYFEGYVSFIVTDEFSCLVFRQSELTVLMPPSTESPGLLGEKPEFSGQAHSMSVSERDLLIIARSDDIDTLGGDYLRTTLSRFPDSIDMALRQIKTRISHNSASKELFMIIARVDALAAQKRSWVDRLRNR